MNWNYPVSVGGSVRGSNTEKRTASWVWVRIIILAAAVLGTAGAAVHFANNLRVAKLTATRTAATQSAAHRASSKSKQSISVPLFFEPNQGQTDPRVKFLARGRGYGLFLTADEAVLELQPAVVKAQRSASSSHISDLNSERSPSSVIRMRLAGAKSSARVSGASPLPGKSNYFIGSDPSKWRHNIPQFARVQYRSIYPGVDLVYYGNQGQLEYDFRLAPGADPNQIALNFSGASARIAHDSGDLVLSTGNGDVRFHAPHIYQPASTASGTSTSEQTVAGSFRQLADNKIGFSIGDYDRSRELVIDPTLTYSTYIGGSGTEKFVQVAVGADQNIYLAGSTNSVDFPSSLDYNANPPIQPCLGEPGSTTPPPCPAATAQNIFIAVINPSLTPPQSTDAAQLVYMTYLGGTGTDTLAGLAVDSNLGIYVAGTTTSADFPNTPSNAFQTTPQVASLFPGTHSFLSKISFNTTVGTLVYNLSYSTFLAGNGIDNVTGLAIDPSCGNQSCNAYVTGNTTSSNLESNGFPANANGYQITSNSPSNPQFFASKINPNGSGSQSMLYSTYFGSEIPAPAVALGGGVAVDTAGNMYITGTTNMLPSVGLNSGAPFEPIGAQQPCLDTGNSAANCPFTAGSNPTDAIVAKFNPSFEGSASLVYFTYLGGTGNDTGNAIAVDSTGNAYVTGSTQSIGWVPFNGTAFQTAPGGAYIAKIGTQSGSAFPLTYFTYLGGPLDVGNAIVVDSNQAVRVAGTTSGDLPATLNPIQAGPASSYSGTSSAGGEDAFVASISTTSGTTTGDFLSYLGGNGTDQGTGVALDVFGATYVAGNTNSTNFPVTTNPFQATVKGSTDAFVSKIGAVSNLSITTAASSPAPSPAAAGVQVAFTFNILNQGPDPAYSINFAATVAPNTGLASLSSPPTGKMTQSTGSCSAAAGTQEIVNCNIPTLPAGQTATVEIDVTTNDTTSPVVTSITASATANANGGITQAVSPAQTVPVVDFTIAAAPPSPSPVIPAGQPASIVVTFCPSVPSAGYSATITPTDSITPSMTTASTPTFNPTTVILSGSACASTTLTIQTTARPVTTGSLLRRGSLYATWLPIGGLSLIGLGVGTSGKRRRWLIVAVLCMIAGVLVLLPGCGSASTPSTTPAGTQAGTYNITITGSAGTGASHNAFVSLRVT